MSSEFARLGQRSERFKRTFDVVLSASLLVLLFPVLAVIALAVWTNLGRPILFQQERPGLGGSPFTLVKFRTMREAFDASGEPLPDSERLTGLGRLLRATSLDELPALFCVLKGDMSLVGPRPLLVEYLPLYSPEQRRRHQVRPGMTGWAQVSGRNAVEWKRRLELDVWYVDHSSLWLDLKIIAMTVLRVIRRDGISQPGHATAERFYGDRS